MAGTQRTSLSLAAALAAAAALALLASCGKTEPQKPGGTAGPKPAAPGPGAESQPKPPAPPPAAKPPTVSITSPAKDAELDAPAAITITAAAGPEGRIAKVEFYQGTAKLGECAAAPFSFTWKDVPAGSYALTARVTDQAGATAASAEVAVKVKAPAKAANDAVWIEDDLPAGANAQQDGEDAWTWVEANPAPQGGKKCHQSNAADGEHQHFFTDATATLEIKAGDKLVAWVFLDKDNPPTEIMLQWHEGGSWEHRAYWGANSVDWGADGTESRLSMGALPAAGKWVRLEVGADKVGLEGKTLDGMAFTLFGGKASWDAAGKTPK
jgi:hypothetical protein